MRNKSFSNEQWTPSGPSLKLRQQSIAGPFKFMNPTMALYDINSHSAEGGDASELTDQEKQERAKVRWNARDYRKGRHVLVLPKGSPLASRMYGSSHPNRVLVGIARMFTMFPYWDVSWLIGISFTFGCLIFVACGLFYWLPQRFPETEFHNESSVAGGVTAFVGATIFQIGAILLFLEAYNDRAETQFGGAVEHIFCDRLKIHRVQSHRPKHYEAGANPQQQATPVNSNSDSDSIKAEKKDDKAKNAASDGEDMTVKKTQTTDSQATEHEIEREEETYGFSERQWKWWPSWYDVKTHYVFEVGFLASLTMSIGATVFYVSGIMALPGIFDKLDETALHGGYYFTYLFGGLLFAIASVFYILEMQPNWYTPQPFKIGWHIGAWNLVGSIGWTLAASLGYCSAEWCEEQGSLTLIWASAAFALGSALQWYESLDKYVVVLED